MNLNHLFPSAGNRPVIKTPTAQAVKEKDGVFTASCQDGDAAPIFDLDAHDEVDRVFWGLYLGPKGPNLPGFQWFPPGKSHF